MYMLMIQPIRAGIFTAILSCSVVLFAQFSFAQEVVSTSTEAEVISVLESPIKVEQLSSTPEPIGDYVVGPGKVEVEVRPGQSVTKYITVSNRMEDDRFFNLTVEDMSGTADGSESIVLLGDQEGPYTLRDYISFPRNQFELDLNQRAIVPVTITMPENAEPGGYYGSVLVSTIKIDPLGDAVAPRSPILARVGVLFFIRVPGEAEVSGNLLQFETKNGQKFFNRGPVEMAVTYENTGSVHLNPYGEVRVTNLLGQEVGFVELEPWFVLPKSLRLQEVTWDRETLFGRYKIDLKINRGYDDIVDEKSLVVWIIPWQVILAVFVFVTILHLLISWIRRNFEFKRKGK